MKTADQIKNAITRLETELGDIRVCIDKIRVWCNSGNVMQEKEFFVEQMKYLDDLLKQEWQAEYRIRAYRWVLDIKDES